MTDAGSAMALRVRPDGAVGRPIDLEISGAWLIDPVAGRSGAADLVIAGGVIESVVWLEGHDAAGIDERGVIVAPGFIDLHTHLREPGGTAAESIASGLAAAAHGGFTTVCAMPNTSPPIDRGSMVHAAQAAAEASGSPVRLLQVGCVTASRAGEQLAALGELADAGVVGFSDDGSPVQDAALFRNALAYAAMLGRPVIDHPEDLRLTAGAEAGEGLVATVLGLQGWPAAAEAEAVTRDIALLAEVARDQPEARLHLTHLSTAASLAHVRAAKAAGLRVTCDVTPHHLALADEWLAGARRWAWEALDANGTLRDPWRDDVVVAAPYDTALRVNPPLRAATDARACLAALADGTADAVATDHAPHSEVDKAAEFGAARPGIAGIETALGVLLEVVDAGLLPLQRAVAALTVGPASVLGAANRRPSAFVAGEAADLVLFDRGARWDVAPATLRTKGFGHPLAGRSLPGEVLLTIAAGRVAYEAQASD
ncbi:MAG TPA: dihydroorotase [Candidatus Limnocylindrales bacterium]|nr:dihydroorotase [Candidatus Limnocylindrales bacterium]